MEPRRDRFHRLVAPHHDAALAFARSVGGSRADGDDLFQASLMRAYDKLDQLREEAAFKPWFFRLVVNVHRNRSRLRFWRRLVPLDAGAPEPAVPGELPDEVLGGAARARRALARLPAEQRVALVLFEVEGWTVEEIAATESVSVSAVKSRLSRGRDRLRDFYQRELGAGRELHALPSPGESS